MWASAKLALSALTPLKLVWTARVRLNTALVRVAPAKLARLTSASAKSAPVRVAPLNDTRDVGGPPPKRAPRNEAWGAVTALRLAPVKSARSKVARTIDAPSNTVPVRSAGNPINVRPSRLAPARLARARAERLVASTFTYAWARL